MIAHRGASATWPGNTLPAFREAVDQGSDAVELDVRRTADGAPLVHHDAVVPGLGPIVARPAADWRRAAPRVPTLAEALDACEGLWVDIEVKNSPSDPDWDPEDALVARVIDLLVDRGWTERVLLTSFNPATLARGRRLAPGVPTGWLIEGAGRLPLALEAVPDGGHFAVLPHAALLGGAEAARAAAAAHARGVALITWTVDDEREGRRLAAAGVDGIITNRPGRLRLALDEDRYDHGG